MDEKIAALEKEIQELRGRVDKIEEVLPDPQRMDFTIDGKAFIRAAFEAIRDMPEGSAQRSGTPPEAASDTDAAEAHSDPQH